MRGVLTAKPGTGLPILGSGKTNNAKPVEKNNDWIQWINFKGCDSEIRPAGKFVVIVLKQLTQQQQVNREAIP